MKNLFKNTLFILLILGALSACQNVKDGLTGKKKTNSDEFLVKKRSPLSMPPDYNEIPKPGTLENNEDNKADSKKIKEIFNIEREKKLKNSSTKSVEESILNRIGK